MELDINEVLDNMSSGASLLGEHCSTEKERESYAVLIAAAILCANDKRTSQQAIVDALWLYDKIKVARSEAA